MILFVTDDENNIIVSLPTIGKLDNELTNEKLQKIIKQLLKLRFRKKLVNVFIHIFDVRLLNMFVLQKIASHEFISFAQ